MIATPDSSTRPETRCRPRAIADLAETSPFVLPISDADPSTDAVEFLVLGRSVRERFDEQGVTEADVDEAIERARSE